MEFKHTKTGKIYAYEGVGKMKMLLHRDDQPSNGFNFSNWVDCIFYSREGHIYCREITDFFEHFEKVEFEDNALIKAANDLGPCETSDQ